MGDMFLILAPSRGFSTAANLKRVMLHEMKSLGLGIDLVIQVLRTSLLVSQHNGHIPLLNSCCR